MPSVFIKTYGCQMNVRDSEQVARDLAGRGYELVETEERADVVERELPAHGVGGAGGRAGGGELGTEGG